MSILTYPLGFIGGGKEFYNAVMENSARFNVADSTYLKRTTKAGGNEDKWTASWWVKRGTLAATQGMIGAQSAASPYTNNYSFVDFNTSDKISIK